MDEPYPASCTRQKRLDLAMTVNHFAGNVHGLLMMFRRMFVFHPRTNSLVECTILRGKKEVRVQLIRNFPGNDVCA